MVAQEEGEGEVEVTLEWGDQEDLDLKGAQATRAELPFQNPYGTPGYRNRTQMEGTWTPEQGRLGWATCQPPMGTHITIAVGDMGETLGAPQLVKIVIMFHPIDSLPRGNDVRCIRMLNVDLERESESDRKVEGIKRSII